MSQLQAIYFPLSEAQFDARLSLMGAAVLLALVVLGASRLAERWAKRQRGGQCK